MRLASVESLLRFVATRLAIVDRYRGVGRKRSAMRVVDTHTHVWGPDTDELPWAAPILPPGWEGTYTHDDLIADMDAADVDEAVVVSTPLYGHEEGANEYTFRAIEAHPDRLWGVAILEWFPESPSALAERLARLVRRDRILGVRAHAVDPSPGVPDDERDTAEWLLDDRLEPALSRAAEMDATVFVFAEPEQLPTVVDLADRYPGLGIVLDHMAAPAPVDPDGPWAAMERLAERESVSVKVSSIPRASREEWPYEDCHEHLRRLLDWFGAERLMVGSDYPWLDDWARYEQCLSWLEGVEFLSPRDRRFLSAGTFDARRE
jgi:L-fuconolactonase